MTDDARLGYANDQMMMRGGLIGLLVLVVGLTGLAPASADDVSDQAAASDADERMLSADVDPDAKDSDGDGTPDTQEDGDIDNDGVPDAAQEEPPTDPFDVDGDGAISEAERASRKEFAELFDDIPNEPDLAALDARRDEAALAPSMTAGEFRDAVRIVRGIVLAKLATRIATKSDRRMAKFSWIVFGFSCLGVLLLAMPLALARQYPGRGKLLFRSSGVAALTFFVTVNLFGGALFGLRTAQGALASSTNPSIAIASSTFDTLHRNADDYRILGKELFAPTLEQMRNHPDEQPAVLLIENGVKIVKDAKVFMSIAKMVRNLDGVFASLPIVLMVVTMLLFVLAIRPTLVEIVRPPATGAANAPGMRRVQGALLATAYTAGVLAVLTLLSSFMLGKLVEPALEVLLGYFSIAVAYLQFVEGASSGLVFVTLFGVVLFLVLALVAVILSVSCFVGKLQKIFQARFIEGAPLASHARFFTWGLPSVVLVQVFPLLFVYVAQLALGGINDRLLSDATSAESVAWVRLLLAGPALLVVGFAVTFWAVRGVAAIKFLQAYRVKPRPRKASRTGPAIAQPLP